MDIERQRASTMSIVDKNAMAVQDMYQKIDYLKRQHEDDCNFIKQQFNELEAQVKQYHHNLFLAMKAM